MRRRSDAIAAAVAAAVLCATPPARADQEPPSETPAETPAEAPGETPAETPGETLEDASRGLDQAADLAGALGEERASRELERLSHAAAVASTTAELAELIASAQHAEAAGWHAGVIAGAGGERSPDDGLATELDVFAGMTVSGVRCALFDAGAQIGVTTPRGFGAVEYARACLSGFQPDPEENPNVEAIRLSVHELAGWNIRPSVDAAAVIGNARYATAEAGLAVEGMIWHYHPRRELVGLGIDVTQGVMTQAVEDDRRTILDLAVVSWFGEWRILRPPGAVGDAVLRVIDMEVDEIESGEVLGTFALSPLTLRRVGMLGVYLDASGGFAVTTNEEGATPEEMEVRPGVLTGAWLLGLTVGVRRLHLRAENRRRLLPTLTAAAMVEDRSSAAIHLDLGPVYLSGGAYRALGDLYLDGDDAVDQEVESWGGDGELWIRLGDHLSAGATLEVGRSFTFADPGDDLSTLPDPAFGFRALGTVAWRTGRVQPLTDD
jgi:hypothetical protein